jgi:hypothetical protein
VIRNAEPHEPRKLARLVGVSGGFSTTIWSKMTAMRWGILALAACAACGGDSPPGRTFYQRNIEPILTQKCAGNTSGCHSTNPGDPYKIAAGNFDVTSFENVQKRRDVLAPFGAYPYPLLLIKAVPTGALKIYYPDSPKTAATMGFLPLEVQHSGGAVLDATSDAFFTLQSWLENGATENGLKPATPPKAGSGGCSHTIPPGFSKGAFVTAMTQGSFDAFKATVQPILKDHGCTAGSCHGAPQSDFYITCGETDDELAFNFSQAWSFVNSPVEDSQILRIPLAAGAGGRGHTGGDQFASTTDKDYVTVRTWAQAAGKLEFAKDPGRTFFAQNIQPLLLSRGCSFQACHSPAATNDFKLRSGTQGFFSAVVLEKNYELLKSEFMAVEFPDARRGRAVAKGLLDDDSALAPPDSPTAIVAGIIHRGGSVLETPGQPASRPCPTFNPVSSSAFCTFQAWIDIERTQLLTDGKVSPMTTADTIPIVFVERPANTTGAGRLEFDSFQGGAQIKVANAGFAANEVIQPVDAGTTSLSAGCPGLSANADVQAPDVANDGNRVVFAGRNAATEPLGVFVTTISSGGSDCVRVTPADTSGLKIHNFDPAFSPDGKWIVFASTRGKSGPTLSRKRRLPQADLWRVKITGLTADQGSYEQLTFLSNSEVGPQFMREGRITMTTEKASDGFYQLSGRRINWDKTDYHPLLAQRAISLYADPMDLMSTKPSVNFASATDIREGSDGNFLVILSDLKPDGSPVAGAAGALGIFNRSVGPFEDGRTDKGFVPALHLINGATATGRAGATAGYRSPVTLPDGTIMASFTNNLAGGNFQIVAVNPRDGSQRQIITGGTGAHVDAVLALKYPERVLYDNRRQLVFGGNASGDAGHAILHMPDAPLVFTLLTGNLRRGRPVEAFRKAKFLAVYSEGLCPANNCTPGANGIYESRQLLGTTELASDGSVLVQLPSATGVVLELQDDNHNSIVKMGEEHQLGPGEQISMGVTAPLFDAVCAGCHGSISGEETDVRVTADALTGASASIAITKAPATVGN